MTKQTRSKVVVGVALGLCAPMVGGCGLGVLSRTPNPDAASNTPPVMKLIACDPANLAGPSCAQTCMDAQTIMQNLCDGCHQTGSIGGLADPADYHSLSNVQASSKFPGQVYVLPGDPDRSLIYKRIAVDRDMPPPSTIDSQIPQPSISDVSVLREWIQSCIPNVPRADAGPAPADAGADGAGPFVYLTCPASPPSGTCATQGMVCPYSTQSCTCDGRNWGCQPCPTAQPANGSACPVIADNQGSAAPFACAYGHVTCNCVGNGLPSQPPAWACGVCPASSPSTGQACGNTSISCAYDQEQCDCVAGTWTCLQPRCPATDVLDATARRCSGFYSCDYPKIDQACTCTGTLIAYTELSCSCPAAPPKAGTFCQATENLCVYSDQTCFCNYAGWQCTQQCPVARPTDGSACSSSLNCSYGGGLCYCDGAAWHCS
jgi:hypothetical protein